MLWILALSYFNKLSTVYRVTSLDFKRDYFLTIAPCSLVRMKIQLYLSTNAEIGSMVRRWKVIVLSICREVLGYADGGLDTATNSPDIVDLAFM